MANPKRKADLVIEEMAEETLVYSGAAQKAYCLNGPCTHIFKLCDGSRDVEALVRESGLEQRTVQACLAILHEQDLLESAPALPRRELLKGALAALPLVLVVAAPEPAAAASAVGGCVTNIQCGATPGIINRCNPCDNNNSSPADCSDLRSYCMSTFRVRVDSSGDPIPGDTCANDSQATGFLNQCDFVNPKNIWALDCDAARQAVINARIGTQPISNYKCCHCAGRP